MSKVLAFFILFMYLSISHGQESPKVAPFSSLVKPVIGGKTSFTCQSLLGSPPFRVVWLKDGEELSNSQSIKIHTIEGSSMLILDPITSGHSGNYTCKISNSHGFDSYTSELTVEGPPHWIEKPINVNLHHGEDVIVPCIVSGYPKPRIIWKRFDGSSWIEIVNDKLFRNEGQKLIIKQADRNVNGRYSCSASNNIQPDLWTEFSVIIQGKSFILSLFLLESCAFSF